MKYKTAITDIKNGKEFIRGYALSDLMQKKSFVETIFLILRGELPNEKETHMMNALFTAAIDHGPGTASAQTARIAASANSDLHVSVAAGILAMGERHGSAIETAARMFQEPFTKEDVPDMIQEMKELNIRVPGFGHPVLEHDERSDALFGMAKEYGFFGPCCERALMVHEALHKQSSKKLALNIDGAMAAILSDMGFAPEIMKGMFIIARVPGLVAQVYEEMTHDEGIRRVPQEDIEYTGPAERAL